MTEQELKPCPFCGKPALFPHSGDCYFRISKNKDARQGDIESSWNTRPREDALQHKLETAIAALRTSLHPTSPGDVMAVQAILNRLEGK